MYPSSRHGKFQNNLRLNTGLRAPTGYKQQNLNQLQGFNHDLNV